MMLPGEEREPIETPELDWGLIGERWEGCKAQKNGRRTETSNKGVIPLPPAPE